MTITEVELPHEIDEVLSLAARDAAREMAAAIGDPHLVIQAGIELLMAQPAATLSDATLSVDVRTVRKHIGRLEAVFADYALGSHRRGVCGFDAYRSTPAWLSWRTGLTRGQVSRSINTGEVAELLPALGAAWRAGHVTTGAVEAIAAARVDGYDDDLVACEPEFLDLALRGDHKGLRRAAEAFKAHADADGSRPVEPDGLRLSKVLDGRTSISGELSSDAAETVTTALQAFMDPPSETDDRTAAQRRADALVRICQIALARGATGSRASAGVTVVIDWAALTAGTPGMADGLFTGPLDRRDIERLLCDSSISRVVTGPNSEVIESGRAQRAFPEATRRAIVARDRGCRWPGCEVPAGWCDAHHHQRWCDGGESSVGNGLLLCPHHHRFLHRHPEWHTTFHEQTFRVFRPDGRELHPNPWLN